MKPLILFAFLAWVTTNANAQTPEQLQNWVETRDWKRLTKAAAKKDLTAISFWVNNVSQREETLSSTNVLICATALNEQEVVKALLKKGNANARQEGWSALMEAAWHGHTDLLGLLLDNGAEVNHRNFEGQTALMIAAKRGNLACCEKLLQRNANVLNADHYGATALSLAVENNHDAVVQWLLQQTAVTASKSTITGALVLAVLQSNHPTAQLLLSKGADANAKDPEYHYPLLSYAVLDGDLKMAELLIKAGADVNQTTETGDTPLWFLLYGRQPSVEGVKLLMDNTATPLINTQRNDKQELLEAAVYTRNADIIDVFIQKGLAFDPQQSGRYWAALVLEGNDFEVTLIDWLLDKKLNINAAINKEGETLLMAFIAAGQTSKALYLIANGADIHIKNKEGNTALTYSAMMENHHADNKEIPEEERFILVKTLLGKGADPYVQDQWGNLSFFRVCDYHLPNEILSLLNPKKTNVNHTNAEGQSLLQLAALNYNYHYRKDKATIEWLIKHGANVNFKDKLGQTPLLMALAYANDNMEVALYLLDNGSSGAGTCEWRDAWDWLYVLADKLSHSIEEFRSYSEGEIDYNEEVQRINQVQANMLKIMEKLQQKGIKNKEIDPAQIKRLVLVAAAKTGNLELVEKLLNDGFDLNKIDEHGTVMLDNAVFSGNAEIVKMLIAKGAKPNYRVVATLVDVLYPYNAAGYARTYSLSQSDIQQIVQLLLANINDPVPADLLFHAVEYPVVIDELLKKGANINTRDNLMNTPLLHLIWLGHGDELKNTVSFLLDKGADIKAQNDFGQTALHLAIERDDADLIKLLIERGADVLVKNGYGKSPAMLLSRQ